MSLLPKDEIDILSLAKMGYKVQFEETKEPEILRGEIGVPNTIQATISINGIPQTPDGSPSMRYLDNVSGECIAAVWTNSRGQVHREGLPAVVHERSEATGAPANTSFKDQAHLINGELHSKKGVPTVIHEISYDSVNYELSHIAFWEHDKCVRFIDYEDGEVEFDSSDPKTDFCKPNSDSFDIM